MPAVAGLTTPFVRCVGLGGREGGDGVKEEEGGGEGDEGGVREMKEEV